MTITQINNIPRINPTGELFWEPAKSSYLLLAVQPKLVSFHTYPYLQVHEDAIGMLEE